MVGSSPVSSRKVVRVWLQWWISGGFDGGDSQVKDLVVVVVSEEAGDDDGR